MQREDRKNDGQMDVCLLCGSPRITKLDLINSLGQNLYDCSEARQIKGYKTKFKAKMYFFVSNNRQMHNFNLAVTILSIHHNFNTMFPQLP